MTSLLTLAPISQASPDSFLTILPIYIITTLLSLIIFVLGIWLRPLIESAFPQFFPKQPQDNLNSGQSPEVLTSIPLAEVPQAPPKVIERVIEPEPAPTQIELDYINFEYEYFQRIIQQYEKKDFWVAANQQPLPLSREEFFVTPQFSSENPAKRGLYLGDLLKLSNSLALFGPPGSGKSETVVYLLLTYARNEIASRLRIKEARQLPVFLSAPELINQLTDSPEISLPDILQENLSPPHESYIPDKLEDGHFLILIDDLNETIVEQAQTLITWLETQATAFPKNRIMVVARPSLKTAFSEEGPFVFTNYEELGDDALKALTEKWQIFVPDALNTLVSIVQEENVYPLAKTPLQLLMLLAVGLTTRTLPTQKTQLYANYIHGMLAFGEQEHTPPLSLLTNDEKQRLLQRVAYDLHQNRQLDLSDTVLRSTIQKSLSQINEKLTDEDQVFIDFMLRSGLLTRNNGHYRFAHLTYQEFLTAQGQNLDTTSVEQILDENPDDPWWHEVNTFYQGMMETSHVIDQVFMQETKDLPNIDKNQAYTLSLLVENLDGFEATHAENGVEDIPSDVFDFDFVNLESGVDDTAEKSIKVMVVDDTPQNLQLARFILQRESYMVMEANNAQEALGLIQDDKPSLILSDIQMPGMDGYEFCRRLKADPETQHIPFIFVTAFSRSTKEAARGLQIGADDYITRPFAPEELLARIGANVRIHQAEEAARRQATILARRNRELALLNQIQRAVTSSLNLDDVLDATIKQVQKVLKAEATSLWFVDPANQALLLTAAYNESAQTIHGIRLPLKESMSGYVVQSAQPFLSGNIQEHPDYVPLPSDRDDSSIHSMMGIPLRMGQKVIGILQAVHNEQDYFNQDDLHLLNAVGDAVTVAIENAWLFGQIQLFNQQLEQKVEARTHELAHEKEKTETILISIADSLLVTDNDNKIIMANRAAEALLDFEFKDAMGLSVELNRFDTPLWEFVRDILSQPNRTYTAQTEVLEENNSEGILAVQAHSSKMIDPSAGAYTGNVIVLRDVTALQEVDRMKARFMTGITHELKTPIAIMTLHISSLIKYRTLDEAKKLDMLNTIQRQASLLERLVENILDLSRLDAGLQIQREPLNIVDMTRQIASELEPLAREKGLLLEFSPSDKEIMVEADSNQLERVFRNLIDNAIKYTPQGKISVLLSTKRNEETLAEKALFQVQDTGIGLTKDQISRLFERFYRADPSHNIPGTGLGLSIAQEITKKHNGEINIESEAGKGSTFSVQLPLL